LPFSSSPELPNNPKNQRQPNTQQNARNDRKIKRSMPPPVENIPRQSPQPKRQPSPEKQKPAGSEHNSKYQQRPSGFTQRFHRVRQFNSLPEKK
jgi:hypothetical protein